MYSIMNIRMTIVILSLMTMFVVVGMVDSMGMIFVSMFVLLVILVSF